MQSILFKVEGQRIESTSDVVVVAKSKHEYKAVFSFSSEWEALENKVAYFKTPKLKEPVFVELQDNECEIPVEALETPYFTVSVAAGDLRTATVCDVVVEETGYSDAAEPALSPKGRRRYADSLFLNGKQLQLTEEGTPIGDIVTIPDFDKFELWNDITLQEDVSLISLSQTDGGKPLKVKKLFLFFLGKFSETDFLALRFNSGTMIASNIEIDYANTEVGAWVYFETIKKGTAFSIYPKSSFRGFVDGISQGVLAQQKELKSSFMHGMNADAIKLDLKLRTAKMSSGSRILVWGMQDDE